MMIATNWGVFEFGKREDKFRDADDPRDMQIRARSVQHLDALRAHFPALGETVYLGYGVADFQYRVYITHKQLSEMMYVITGQIDYVRFKEGAHKDGKLYKVLSDMWSTLLNAYPEGSSYTAIRGDRRRDRRKYWWEDAS